MSKRHPQITNINEVDAFEMAKGPFGIKSKSLAQSSGAKEIGCNWFELAPGKSSFPFHFHTGIEESLFVIKGTGTLRIGKESVSVKEGDYVSFPAGPEYAHALKNTGTEPLQYLALSNKNTVDVVGYPDSKKVAVTATNNPNEWPPHSAWIRMIIKEQPSVDYFEGEI